MKLDGATVLITGAGSGIGRALAVTLSAEGADCILTGRRPEALEETRKAMTRADDVLCVPADLTKSDDRARLALTVEQHFGPLNLLVNNAGVVGVNLLANAADDELRGMVETNVIAPMSLTRALLPALEKAEAARVVNVGSMFGDIAFPYFAGYSATKFAMRGFSDALRRELAPKGIGVTYCAPRATKTPAAGRFDHLVEPFQMKLDSPEAVADLIVTAVAKDARSAYPKGPERLFVLIQRLFPKIIDNALSGQYKKARQALGD